MRPKDLAKYLVRQQEVLGFLSTITTGSTKKFFERRANACTELIGMCAEKDCQGEAWLAENERRKKRQMEIFSDQSEGVEDE